MDRKKYLYSSGEFARLNGINKRTLHYYHDIGLFSPQVIEENGYHYYTSMQIVQLELILTLRRIGIPLEEIKRYVNSPSDSCFAQMVAEKKKLIDESIEQLLTAKTFLQQKSDKLEMSMEAEHGKVEQVWMPERRILLSGPITGSYDDVDFSVAAEFSLRLKKLFGLYDNFGSRISVDNIQKNDFEHYDAFYAYGRENVPVFDELLPEGKYIRAFSIGSWDGLREVYERILAYTGEHGLTLRGYAYEEGLNEMFIQKIEDYIVMIMIRCE